MAQASPPFGDDIYRLVVETTTDYAVFVLDAGGRIRTWNQGARRLKGYEPHEIIGRHFSIFYPQESVASGWPQHELRVAAEQGRFEDEGWRLRKDGSRFWASVTITALRDQAGELLGFSKITRDLTERRLREEALRQSEERFRLLVEGVVDYAIFMLDPSGVVTSWNAGAQRIKGYRREEVVGRHFSMFYPPEDLAAGRPDALLAEAAAGGRAVDEGWRLRKGGERFWARAIVTALHDPEGRLRGFAKITQDLTPHRHARELEEATRNMNEFIGVLAHELRNPLAPIRTAVAVMEGAPPESPVQEAMRRAIDRQSRQLARIVDDLLDISRITRGSMHIGRSPIDLADVMRQAVETSAPAIDAGRHHLEVLLPRGPLLVNGDAQRLTQVLANLLNNAARYTPEGGLITVAAEAEGEWAVVRVRDNGRGIDPALLQRVFQMFVQGRAPLERVGGGLGIGLALSRKIAELHDGALEAHSEGENKGSEFVLRLPRLEEEARPPPDGHAADSPPMPGARRVLIVDDNVDAATTLDLLLRSLGHDTRVAHDGMQALAAAENFDPEVVLLDIGMPGLDGYEVARRLRSRRPLARIVAVTGWGQDVDRQKSRAAGFDVHLVKPVDMASLAEALGKRGDTTTLH